MFDRILQELKAEQGELEERKKTLPKEIGEAVDLIEEGYKLTGTTLGSEDADVLHLCKAALLTGMLTEKNVTGIAPIIIKAIGILRAGESKANVEYTQAEAKLLQANPQLNQQVQEIAKKRKGEILASDVKEPPAVRAANQLLQEMMRNPSKKQQDEMEQLRKFGELYTKIPKIEARRRKLEKLQEKVKPGTPLFQKSDPKKLDEAALKKELHLPPEIENKMQAIEAGLAEFIKIFKSKVLAPEYYVELTRNLDAVYNIVKKDIRELLSGKRLDPKVIKERNDQLAAILNRPEVQENLQEIRGHLDIHAYVTENPPSPALQQLHEQAEQANQAAENAAQAERKAFLDGKQYQAPQSTLSDAETKMHARRINRETLFGKSPASEIPKPKPTQPSHPDESPEPGPTTKGRKA